MFVAVNLTPLDALPVLAPLGSCLVYISKHGKNLGEILSIPAFCAVWISLNLLVDSCLVFADTHAVLPTLNVEKYNAQAEKRTQVVRLNSLRGLLKQARL